MSTVLADRRIRIAVVGCGRISENHFGAIAQHAADLELVAVCDTDPAAVARATEKYGVKGYSSLEEMLKSGSLDVVFPGGASAPLAMQETDSAIRKM
jgi:UDP-N-acetyl-2-amino-2-deoxyglucuronate dehydrogenase